MQWRLKLEAGNCEPGAVAGELCQDAVEGADAKVEREDVQEENGADAKVEREDVQEENRIPAGPN